MPRLLKKAVLDLRCNKLFVEGEEFPWYITEDGVDVSSLMDSNAIPTLSFTIFAETVDVIPADDTETTTK